MVPVKNCLFVRITIVRKLCGNIYISPPRSYPRGFLNTEMESTDNSGLNKSLDIYMNALYEVLSRKEVQKYFQQCQRCWHCLILALLTNVGTVC